jgi:hypothetical protein
MSKTLEVGQSFIATITASDGTVIPPGGVTCANTSPGAVTVTPNGDNSFTVLGKGPGAATLTYQRAGFTSASEAVNVNAIPLKIFVITEGPTT